MTFVGKRRITIRATITCDVNEVVFNTPDERDNWMNDPRCANGEGRSLERRLERLLPDATFEFEPTRTLSIELSDADANRLRDMVLDQYAAEDKLSERASIITDRLLAAIVVDFPNNDRTPFIFSADAQALIDNDVFASGLCQFVYDSGWDDDDPIISDVYQNPTHQGVVDAAIRAFMRSNDRHHVFFEGARFRAAENGVSIFELFFGS